MAVILHHEGGE